MENTIYLDHAATSWPKPPAVGEAMMNALQFAGANPGRGSHRMAVQASRVLFETRKGLATLFGIKNPNDIAFGSNTTEALNLAIQGVLQEGDHVIATMAEHNSVRRPLEFLRRQGKIEIDYVPVTAYGAIDLKQMERMFRKNTRLVVCTHSSNLLGSILPIGEISELCRRHHALLLVDAAQSVGIMPVDVGKLGIDMLAFPGHKGLLGPQGTGGLYIAPELDVQPLLHGGTGSQSEAVEQPKVRPDRYEAGTPNTVGIAGLGAGVKHVLAMTPASIYQHEWELTQHIMNGLSSIKGIQLLGPDIGQPRSGLVSFIIEGYDSAQLAFRLDRNYGIAVRSGFHCTPLAHESAGTTATGAVRASVGYNSSHEEVDELIRAITELTAVK
ncbi:MULTISPECIES: aminotransferase class V-fold PLP-dependent enzyme [Paenibacillus]|uniref:cysteine desulfurase n=1 Tax=Paenibacillus cucumis (ex Kampfer et al. 2016) TaxID=1776858 RepID=A0ABS7KFA4_9BACL|nr:aminotransferase class V-fold PLP-dependent enzyme [Paenibacillus cucumis (ex Kampfer et al. 2016)]MBY0202824.1 aminotransferase class V-fold PLP-dependent enzyme [Paenibacillus cucumis (ex Kampfer et al. 2016)]MDP9700466.1 cysteine desulfurase family protein [Paenibacillus intestini]